jgi:hypothetical protein
MTVHTKWEILVQKLLKSVELFKSYGLFGERKVVDFLCIRRIHYYRRKHDNLLGSENNIFWSKNVIF